MAVMAPPSDDPDKKKGKLDFLLLIVVHSLNPKMISINSYRFSYNSLSETCYENKLLI